MPDANGRFRGITVPDSPYTRSLDKRRLIARKLAELDRVADAAPYMEQLARFDATLKKVAERFTPFGERNPRV